MTATTESIDPSLIDLDLRNNDEIIQVLLQSQRRAVDAVEAARNELELAVTAATERLSNGDGRLVLVGAGASGRLAVQDGAELWPTYGWPHERLLLCMAGGAEALLSSIEGVEDDADAAYGEVVDAAIGNEDVVLALAASGRSPWTCAWMHTAGERGAVTIGMANNPDTPLLQIARYAIWLDSGAEVLAGSTRMSAGTAQKIALNLFSTTLMVRLNRTYGNLMVDMAAANSKLDQRRVRLLQGVLGDIDDEQAAQALASAGGWVKLAALVAMGDTPQQGKERLRQFKGSLRLAMHALRGSA